MALAWMGDEAGMVIKGEAKLRSRPRGRLSADEEPERKSEIIDATIRIIKRDGWGRVTIRGIAAELGLTTGVLWYYFADKNDILKASLHRAFEPWLGSVDEALREADPWGALVGLFLPEAEGGDSQFEQAWPNVVSELRNDPELWAIYRREYGAFRESLGRLVVKCQDQGRIERARDAQVEADRLCAVFDGVLVATAGEPDRMTADYARKIMACHLESLQHRGGQL